MDELGSQLWPIHLKPRQGELLSSWVIRLAHGHGYKTEKMCRMLFGRHHSIWCRDIDKLAPKWVLSKLCQVTGTTMDRAEKTTLSAYAGFVAGHINSNGDCPWIVPSHVYHRQRTRPGLMYCPICLKCDEVPFFRRIWRLAFITTCSVHGVSLLDSCPQCGGAIIPHRVDIGPDASMPRDRWLLRCWKCGYDLRTTPTTGCDTGLQLFTRQLEEVVDAGFLALGSNPNLHSVPYFAGIRVVVRFAAKLRGMRGAAIEHMPLIDRQAVMLDVSKLMASWPVNFLDAVRQSKTRYSDLAGSREILPFWIEESVRDVKRHQHPDWTTAEIAEVARIIVNRDGRLSGNTARNTYGVHLPWHRIPSTFRLAVSEENHEMLMATLDQSVAATFDPKIRFSFLQDKVMFCMFRFTDMTTGGLSSLKVSDVELLPVDFSEPEFEHAAGNRIETLRMLSRHIERDRSKVAASTNCPNAFFSPYTGRALSDSAIQLRFRQAVKHAFLTAPVQTMAAYKQYTGSTVPTR